MRIHWGFKEQIHTLLAKAANASDQTEQSLLLSEAGVLLWRFDDETFPRRADDIRPLLKVSIDSWIPKTVSLNYIGPLLSENQPTTLVSTILTDLSGDTLSLRDELVSEVLKVESLGCFREMIDAFLLPGVAGSYEISSACIKERFYTAIPSTQRNDYLYCCTTCGCPLDNNGLYFRCESPFCHSAKYSLIPSHYLVPFKDQRRNLIKIFYNGQLKLNPLAWRTIATPLVFEKIIVKYLKKVLPKKVSSTIELGKHRPGVSIFQSGRRVILEPVATHSAATIKDYYSSLDNKDETWIVVPGGSALLFRHLKEKLPVNYRVVTSQTYPYEYLDEFYKEREKGLARIRCR